MFLRYAKKNMSQLNKGKECKNSDFREFCWAEMTEKQFSAAVFKLNCNILHLCYTQNVNLDGLHPQHTICNIRTLLDHADLGR